MGKRTIFFAISTVLTVLCGWTAQQKNKIKKAEWLIGTWENKTSKGSIYETWTQKNETEFSGKSYILKDRDTVVFENIRLVQEKDRLYYIPTVKNQNEGIPVRFSAKIITNNLLAFENLQHDFPQIISYTKTGENRLIAEISGTKNGQQRSQIFPMQRIK